MDLVVGGIHAMAVTQIDFALPLSITEFLFALSINSLNNVKIILQDPFALFAW